MVSAWRIASGFWKISASRIKVYSYCSFRETTVKLKDSHGYRKQRGLHIFYWKTLVQNMLYYENSKFCCKFSGMFKTSMIIAKSFREHNDFFYN